MILNPSFYFHRRKLEHVSATAPALTFVRLFQRAEQFQNRRNFDYQTYWDHFKVIVKSVYTLTFPWRAYFDSPVEQKCFLCLNLLINYSILYCRQSYGRKKKKEQRYSDNGPKEETKKNAREYRSVKSGYREPS